MAFMAGAWRGSGWSPWSQFGNSNSDSSDTTPDPETTSIIQTQTQTLPPPNPTTATVIQQITTTAISVVTPTVTTPKQVTVTQTPPAPKPTTQPAQTSAKQSTAAAISAQTTSRQEQSTPIPSSISSASRVPSSRSTSISSHLPSASTSSVNNAVVLPDEWIYWGCVPNIDGMPALNTTYATSDELTPALCISACAASQYHFAGLHSRANNVIENGDACFCGSLLTSPSITPPLSNSTCSSSCSGDSTSICGGESSMSFYHLKSFDPSSSSNNSDADPTGVDMGYGGSRTAIATLPQFTGTLMEYGDPRFRNGKDGVVFGEMMKVSSASRGNLPLPLDGRGLVAIIAIFSWRVLR